MSYIESFITKAKERGVTRLHFHIEEIEKRYAAVFNGAAENILASRERLMLIEGEYQGFMGSAYTEDQDADSIPVLLGNITQTAALNRLPYAEKPIRDIPAPAAASVDFDMRGVSEELIAAEKSARLKNAGATNFRLELFRHKKTVILLNGNGKSMTDSSCFFTVTASVMAKNGDKAQTAFISRLSAEKPDFALIANEAAADACLTLNSGPCAGGRYKAVIRNGAFAELFGAFLPAFYAERCQSNMSFLAGKLGEAVGSAAFTVYEDPLALICRRFDDEGTETGLKTLVDKGRLSAYFHNARTAEKDGIRSNGNGFRVNTTIFLHDYKESVSNAYTNVMIESGQKELSQLLAEMGDGLLITACAGVFAGVNPVSGDFSVLAKGFAVRGGELCEPVSGITIGGNFLELLSNVEETGNDFAVTDTNTGIVGTGSVRLSGVVVSGKSE